MHDEPSVDDETVVAPLIVLEHFAVAMVVTVVLEGDPVLGPSHVHTTEERPGRVLDVEVEHGLRESGVDQGEPEPCLHR